MRFFPLSFVSVIVCVSGSFWFVFDLKTANLVSRSLGFGIYPRESAYSVVCSLHPLRSNFSAIPSSFIARQSVRSVCEVQVPIKIEWVCDDEPIAEPGITRNKNDTRTTQMCRQRLNCNRHKVDNGTHENRATAATLIRKCGKQYSKFRGTYFGWTTTQRSGATARGETGTHKRTPHKSQNKMKNNGK